LRTISELSVKPLSELFTQWATQPLALVFSGTEVLNTTLQKATPVGDRAIDPAWWHLRLEALRVQGAHETYENVALDYCMTYEVSPPSWLESNCTYEVAQDQTALVLGDEEPDTEAAALVSEPRAVTALELKGNLLTDVAPLMDQMLQQLPAGEPMTIQCGRLVRVDFAAAGTLLNWLAALPSTSPQIQFVGMPRLVGALFHVMGVTEYASVTLSKK
jgi:ABC-type transporter Mla MlaB component